MDAVIEKWEEILQTVKSEYEVTDVPFNTCLLYTSPSPRD